MINKLNVGDITSGESRIPSCAGLRKKIKTSIINTQSYFQMLNFPKMTII